MSQDSRPPTDYYIITSAVYNATNVTDTNITITGLSSTINYTVTIIPVNIIGYGPSVNINGTVRYNAKTFIYYAKFLVNITLPTSNIAVISSTDTMSQSSQ